ncbi:hypothetical protein Taro_015665 [Colocasia esculenta]|uniref:Uncharacterized protein n=1 Tax=Colocasia esculenta TaxID=4460 RepID=A0A843UI66_COLES|nr:hypothetical protein [Colocasia esculenta]
MPPPLASPDVFLKAPSTFSFSLPFDGGSYSGSRPRRQRITMQQTFPTHSASEGSVAAALTDGSTTSIVGSVSSQAWGQGHGRWGPSRVLTDRRLESGQRCNVKVIGGTGIGEPGAQFVSLIGIVSKLHCKIWQKDFVKLPAVIIDTIFRDLENITDCNKANRSHQSIPYRNSKKSHYQLKDDFERMIQLSATSLDSESRSTPISTEAAFVLVMGMDQSSRIRCGGSRETRCTWYGTGEGPSSTN